MVMMVDDGGGGAGEECGIEIAQIGIPNPWVISN